MQKSFRAFVYAINGLRYAFAKERNFKIEIFFAVFVFMIGLILKLSSMHWVLLVINICSVLAAELFNTAIEKLADISCKEINPVIEIIKDVAAAAVLLTVLSAIICGLIIFIPYIFKLINL